MQTAEVLEAGPVDHRSLRRALGRFVTGVTVVTAIRSDGDPIGVTVNSFTSVSLDPPLVLWCLSERTARARRFTSIKRFAVNVLSSEQRHVSEQFSAALTDRFAGIEWEHGPGGIPLLTGSVATFVCQTTDVQVAGDHLLFIGRVDTYRYTDGGSLAFHSGRYFPSPSADEDSREAEPTGA